MGELYKVTFVIYVIKLFKQIIH